MKAKDRWNENKKAIWLVCIFVTRFTIQLSKIVQFCHFLLTAVKTNQSKFIIPIISGRFHQAYVARIWITALEVTKIYNFCLLAQHLTVIFWVSISHESLITPLLTIILPERGEWNYRCSFFILPQNSAFMLPPCLLENQFWSAKLTSAKNFSKASIIFQ